MTETPKPGRPARPRLFVVHHTPSPATRALLEEVPAGANHPDLEGAVEVVHRPALVTGAVEVLEADGYLLGCPANIGCSVPREGREGQGHVR